MGLDLEDPISTDFLLKVCQSPEGLRLVEWDKTTAGSFYCLRTLLLTLRIAGKTNDAEKMLANPCKSVLHKNKKLGDC